jgi:hypothetical protein
VPPRILGVKYIDESGQIFVELSVLSLSIIFPLNIIKASLTLTPLFIRAVWTTSVGVDVSRWVATGILYP